LSKQTDKTGANITWLTSFWRRWNIYIMVRTQIQLPDELYAKAKRVAEQREISLAELIRRGLETLFTLYPVAEEISPDWKPPKPRRLGCRPLTAEQLRDAARDEAELPDWVRPGRG
jgi:hypothetical protein